VARRAERIPGNIQARFPGAAREKTGKKKREGLSLELRIRHAGR
jgi:hypothetical protein